jgi:proteasome lid subunit RPN8/RPN11
VWRVRASQAERPGAWIGPEGPNFRPCPLVGHIRPRDGRPQVRSGQDRVGERSLVDDVHVAVNQLPQNCRICLHAVAIGTSRRQHEPLVAWLADPIIASIDQRKNSLMRIAQPLLDEIVAHARSDAPDECCGMVSREGEVLTGVHPAANAEASPFRFVIAPREQLKIIDAIEDSGADLGAIYHSHTRTAPEPSQTDINFAASWPGVLWIIVGLAGSEPEVRTWRIDGPEVSEVELEIG